MSIEDWPHTILSLPNDAETANLDHNVTLSSSKNNEPEIRRVSDHLERNQENEQRKEQIPLQEYIENESHGQAYIDTCLNNNHTDEVDLSVEDSESGTEEFKSEHHIDRPRSLFVGGKSISDMALIVTPTHNLMDFSPCTHGTPHTVHGKIDSLSRIVPKTSKSAESVLDHEKQRKPSQMEWSSNGRRKTHTTKQIKVSSAMIKRPKSQGREPDEISSPIHKPIHLRLKRHGKQKVAKCKK
mmetsp:Transcript_13117/g.18210  ORF Transcript_13117/g.18210 Transcript_13117/m.18210 type:complete len:241 (-) Transcript_13117:71-793(-)